LIAIIAAILVSAAAGVAAEHRWPKRAVAGSQKSLLWILYLVLPPVTFFNLAHVDFDTDVVGGIALGIVSTALAGTAAWAIGSRLLGLSRPVVGAMVSCTIVANTAYLGYPMAATLLGSDKVGEAVAYDIGVGAPALLLGAFAVGAAFGTKAGTGRRQRTGAFFARNLPLYAGIAALVAPESLAPDVLVDISRVVVVAILPVGFFAVGTALAQEADDGKVSLPPPITKATLVVIGTKLVLLPGLLLLLAMPLIDLPSTYLLMAAMPCGLNSMIVAHAYGLDLATTAEAVTWTTALVVVVALAASFV